MSHSCTLKYHLCKREHPRASPSKNATCYRKQRYASKVCGGPLLCPNNTYTKEHDIFRSKPNHCISLWRNISCSFILEHLPQRPPHACRLSAYVTFMYSQVSSMQKRAIYSGTNLTTVSVCGGVYRSLSFIYLSL